MQKENKTILMNKEGKEIESIEESSSSVLDVQNVLEEKKEVEKKVPEFKSFI